MRCEWKPGDVALLTFFDEVAIGVRNSKNSGWKHASAWAGGSLSDNVPHEARPLAVIDLEPHQADFVIGVLENTRHSWTTKVADALRVLATSPRPEEPTGLGAVVRDQFGHVYVRTGWEPAPWCNTGEESNCTWSHIDAVEVLSDGVTP